MYLEEFKRATREYPASYRGANGDEALRENIVENWVNGNRADAVDQILHKDTTEEHYSDFITHLESSSCISDDIGRFILILKRMKNEGKLNV